MLVRVPTVEVTVKVAEEPTYAPPPETMFNVSGRDEPPDAGVYVKLLAV
jgi:hypothetical protein